MTPDCKNRFLIVTPNHLMADMFQTVIEHFNQESHSAFNAKSAAEQIKQVQFDGVICVETAEWEEVRKSATRAGINGRFAVFTTYPEIGQKVEATGSTPFSMPFEMDDFVKFISCVKKP